jgi:DNA-binding GntR family transcriptional regulator
MKKRSGRLADDVRLQLEQLIVMGELQPGVRLDEVTLADRFGVSRTPVREALMQLAASGLVDLRPRQGATVAALSLKKLLDMFEVMAELEGMCAKLAARRINRVEREALLAAHAGCGALAADDNPDCHDDYYTANARFHEVIYDASHNPVLQDLVRGLRARCAPYRRLQLRQPGRIGKSYAEHEAIVGAILAGDAAHAEGVLRAHILIQGDVFNDFIAAMPASLVA